jgi:hypothetical protein
MPPRPKTIAVALTIDSTNAVDLVHSATVAMSPTGRGHFPLSQDLYKLGPALGFCLPVWEGAMGSCFHFELMVRLAANRFFPTESVTRDVGTGAKGQGLLDLLFGKLAFSDDERRFLPKCNTLRNKLIHCEPDGVLRLVQEIVPDFRPPSVAQQITLSAGPSGKDVLEAIETKKGAVDVLNTVSREQGFLGWMIQSTGDGTFPLAAQIFGRAVMIIDARLKAFDQPTSISEGGSGPKG